MSLCHCILCQVWPHCVRQTLRRGRDHFLYSLIVSSASSHSLPFPAPAKRLRAYLYYNYYNKRRREPDSFLAAKGKSFLHIQIQTRGSTYAPGVLRNNHLLLYDGKDQTPRHCNTCTVDVGHRYVLCAPCLDRFALCPNRQSWPLRHIEKRSIYVTI